MSEPVTQEQVTQKQVEELLAAAADERDKMGEIPKSASDQKYHDQRIKILEEQISGPWIQGEIGKGYPYLIFLHLEEEPEASYLRVTGKEEATEKHGAVIEAQDKRNNCYRIFLGIVPISDGFARRGQVILSDRSIISVKFHTWDSF